LGTAFLGNTHTHNNGTESLTYTEKPDIEHKTQNRPKPTKL